MFILNRANIISNLNKWYNSEVKIELKPLQLNIFAVQLRFK